MLHNSRPSTNKVLIDFDPAKGRFILNLPFAMNGRARALPNRRFHKASGCWHAPALRANIEAIKTIFESAIYTKAARAKIDGHDAERKGTLVSGGMPAWYSFKRKPRPKQLEAMNKVFGLPASALFMDMRTGKSKVVIDVGCAERMSDLIGAVLLICPLSCRRNWIQNEIPTDATIPVDAYALDTDKPKKFYEWMHKRHDFKWLVVGVESFAQGSAHKYVQEFLLANPKVKIVIDESSRIKTHNAERSKKIVKLRVMSIARQLASGRPMTKNPLDLFMQFEFLDPDIIGLGDFQSMTARYAVKGGYDAHDGKGPREIIGYDNLDELAELIAPYTVQVRQDEVLTSPKIFVVREVEMTAAQRAHYMDLKKRSAINTPDIQLIVQNVLEKMLRMQEVVGGYVSRENTEAELLALRERMGPKAKLPRTRRLRIEGRNPKVEEVMAYVDEYDGPTIVWCAFKDEIYEVRDALIAEYGADQVVECHGDLDEAQRHHDIETRFKAKKARFMVGNAATGGIGLTLSVAEHIIFYSNTFKFEDRSQAEERGVADGKSTVIVDLVARGTTDEIIIAANAEKLDVTEYVRTLVKKCHGADIDRLTAAAMSDILSSGRTE